jgi:hypothetical protein
MPADKRDTGDENAHYSRCINRSTAPVPSRNSEKINDKAVNDKYLHCISGCDWGNDLNSDIEVFLQKLHYFEMKNSDVASCHGVKGRLAKHIKFWEQIGANNFVLETLKKGYVIPFLENPVKMFKKNNRSAMKNAEFVDQAVNEFIFSGCAIEVPFQPYIVNPLSVATHKSGKIRLILDLSILNLSIKKEKVKFEDWKIAVQYFERDTLMFKFDLVRLFSPGYLPSATYIFRIYVER